MMKIAMHETKTTPHLNCGFSSIEGVIENSQDATPYAAQDYDEILIGYAQDPNAADNASAAISVLCFAFLTYYDAVECGG
jgi:hypothetical protein